MGQACIFWANLTPFSPQSAHQQEAGPWQNNVHSMLCATATHPSGYEQNAGFRPWMIVDVRDDAACHVALLESVAVASGERYIAWSTECVNVEDIAAAIPALLPEANLLVQPLDAAATNPTLQADASGASEAELRAIWAGCELRNDRMLGVAEGLSFRPWRESVRDCVESLLSIGGVVPVRASKL
jgi:hypothetical protein